MPQIANGTKPWLWVLVRMRRGMVGRDEDAVVAVLFEGGVQRGDDVGVDLFQGLDLGVGAAFVRGFVGRFDVDADDVGRRRGRRSA